MEIELNGAPHRIADEQNVQQLVASLKLSDKALAIAVNREVVPRHLWAQRLLRHSDRVDIVRAIGGG